MNDFQVSQPLGQLLKRQRFTGLNLVVTGVTMSAADQVRRQICAKCMTPAWEPVTAILRNRPAPLIEGKS